MSTSGEIIGAPALLTGDKKHKILDSIMCVSSVNELPPLAREKVEDIPMVMALPDTMLGYAFFVMPEEDVYIQTNY